MSETASGSTASTPNGLGDIGTCEALYGANLDGPIVHAIDIVKRFQAEPDLSLVTADEIHSTIASLDEIREKASASAAALIDQNEVILRELLTILTTRVNLTVDAGVFKQAGAELLGFCTPYIQ